ncbi:hypothetical protein [Halovenus aranensis]|nr:hypothetical protein [Halovenus aranensis]
MPTRPLSVRSRQAFPDAGVIATVGLSGTGRSRPQADRAVPR